MPTQAFELPALPVFVPAAATALDERPAVPEDTELDALARTGLALHRLLQWRPTPLGGFDWTDLHRQAVARALLTAAERAPDGADFKHAVPVSRPTPQPAAQEAFAAFMEKRKPDFSAF